MSYNAHWACGNDYINVTNVTVSVAVCGRWGSWQETDLPPLLHGASSITPCTRVHHCVRDHRLWGWTSLEKETGCHHSKWSKCKEVLCTSWISEPTCHLEGQDSRVCSRALLWVSCLVAEVILTCILLTELLNVVEIQTAQPFNMHPS